MAQPVVLANAVLAHGARIDLGVGPVAIVVGLAGFVALHQRGARRGRAPARTTLLLAGVAALAVALLPPLDAAAERSVAVHMVQHLLLSEVAAPLLVLATPVATVLRGLPPAPARWLRRRWARVERFLLRRPAAVPLVAGLWSLHLLVWHVPAAYTLAVAHDAVHLVQHVGYLLAGLALWTVVLRGPRVRLGARLAALVVAVAVGTGLGIALTFARVPWYPTVSDDLADQQIGGAVLWGLGGLPYVLAAMVLVAAFFEDQPSRPPLDEVGAPHGALMEPLVPAAPREPSR